MINASFIGRKFNFNFAHVNAKMPTNSEGTNTLKHELHAQIHKELKTPSFKVMQVLTNNVALAHAGEKNMAKYGIQEHLSY
jgi:hypothetical protein